MVANGWQIALFETYKTQKIKDSCGLMLYYTHKGEIQEFASEFQWRFFLRCHTELDDVRFVVRRVVVLGIARNRLNIRFGHCTSCLFDNSSVKLCKHDTPLLFAPSGANYEQGLGQARPNKITSEMQTHCRSEVPVEHNIFKNWKFVATGRFLPSTAALKTHFQQMFPNC